MMMCRPQQDLEDMASVPRISDKRMLLQSSEAESWPPGIEEDMVPAQNQSARSRAYHEQVDRSSQPALWDMICLSSTETVVLGYCTEYMYMTYH